VVIEYRLMVKLFRPAAMACTAAIVERGDLVNGFFSFK
jgi:hypothetical protein